MQRFLDAYITCALWSSSDGDSESLEQTGAEIDSNTVAQMTLDCSRFLGDAQRAGLLDLVLSNFEQAGHDFWLTRNGHGAGFWDGDWPEAEGMQLTAISKTFKEVNLYVGDDGKIYG